jgi:hypothetical protein
MGIYGFLSAAYQETYSKLTAVENQKGFIQQKIDFYQNDVTRYDTEIERISSNISTLSNAKASSIQVRDTTVSGGFRQTISTTELRMAQSRINIEEENRKLAQEKRTIASDSLQKFQLQVLELDNNNEIAGELGPLQYLSGLTGISMDKIINWLLLIIIFVFDPLAISLVIAANFAFFQAYPKKKYRENLYGEKVEDKFSEWDNLEDIEVKDAEREDERKHWENITGQIHDERIRDEEELERRMNIIGQNGNEGEHYSELDLNQDGVIDEKEIETALEKIERLENRLDSDLSTFRKRKIKENIQYIKNQLPNDNETKTY